MHQEGEREYVFGNCNVICIYFPAMSSHRSMCFLSSENDKTCVGLRKMFLRKLLYI